MLSLLRLLAVFAIAGSFAVQMIRTVWGGLKTGKMAHSDSRSFADRRKQPIFFWFLAVLFSLFALGALFLIHLAMLPPEGLPAVR